ncbi:hypothetical protein MKY91_03025 [Alkalicoccobacillus gibsonii]|uniref:Uncharacterized protein n=1 Tax=Alkalicoccobacillus gibsonii TaxID=79881 RepID=A0ABU9VES4_9BACI
MSNEQDTMLLDSEEANEVKQSLQESTHMNLTINDSQERVRPWIVQGGPIVITAIAVVTLMIYLVFKT